MPDWVEMLKLLATGGSGAAIFAGLHKLLGLRYVARRQARQDEVDVLHKDIERLHREIDDAKADRLAMRKESDERWAARDGEISELRSENTACRMREARLRERMKFLEQRTGLASHEDDGEG